MDLWLGFVVAALYSIVYLFGLDRLGLHFYPIFSPRAAFSGVSYGLLFLLYYQIFKLGNHIIALQLGCSAPPPPPPASAWWGGIFRRTGVARERRACLAVASRSFVVVFSQAGTRTVMTYRFACLVYEKLMSVTVRNRVSFFFVSAQRNAKRQCQAHTVPRASLRPHPYI